MSRLPVSSPSCMLAFHACLHAGFLLPHRIGGGGYRGSAWVGAPLLGACVYTYCTFSCVSAPHFLRCFLLLYLYLHPLHQSLNVLYVPPEKYFPDYPCILIVCSTPFTPHLCARCSPSCTIVMCACILFSSSLGGAQRWTERSGPRNVNLRVLAVEEPFLSNRWGPP